MSREFHVTQGESFTPIVTVRTAAGTAVNLTTSGRSLVWRMVSPTGVLVTRTMGTSGQSAWVTDGTDGRVQFLFTPAQTAALETGAYRVELVYTDTTPDPDYKVVPDRGVVEVAAPATGTI